MNKTIRALNKELLMAQEHVEEIDTALQEAYNEVFELDHKLRDVITKLESSQDYMLNAFGEVTAMLHFSFDPYKGHEKYLTEYLREYHCVDTDVANDCLFYDQGPSIIIGETGRVYDQDTDKMILQASDYEIKDAGEWIQDVAKRNQLIEAYMAKRGYYPGVFRLGSGNTAYAVSTKVEV